MHLKKKVSYFSPFSSITHLENKLGLISSGYTKIYIMYSLLLSPSITHDGRIMYAKYSTGYTNIYI